MEALKARGTEIRIVDLEASSVEQLQEQLKDVDIVISAIEWTQFHLQTPLINASKNAGVKRFIPCPFGTACLAGVRYLFDQARAITSSSRSSILLIRLSTWAGGKHNFNSIRALLIRLDRVL